MLGHISKRTLLKICVSDSLIREFSVDNVEKIFRISTSKGANITVNQIRDFFDDIGFNTDVAFSDVHNSDIMMVYNIGGFLLPFYSGLIYILFMLKYDLTKVRLVTFDLPRWIGMTEAFDKKGYFDIETIYRIAEEIIKEYKMEKFNVLGFSYGLLLALMVANIYSDRVERVALVSPIVKSSLAIKSADALKLKFLKYSHLYFLIKLYVRWRFSIYNKPLLEEGIPSQFLYSYGKMMDGIQPRYLFQSLYHLFFSDNA